MSSVGLMYSIGIVAVGNSNEHYSRNVLRDQDHNDLMDVVTRSAVVVISLCIQTSHQLSISDVCISANHLYNNKTEN